MAEGTSVRVIVGIKMGVRVALGCRVGVLVGAIVLVGEYSISTKQAERLTTARVSNNNIKVLDRLKIIF